jgi:WD repeat-containing protein 19
VKDLNYIFRLYIVIGEFAQAATTALLIANQEQACGQYNAAHSILVSIYTDLESHSLPIPEELRRNLLILHSYRLAKIMSQKGDHDSAARMLIRVSKNISKFPTHTVPILTSTVIECQRAGLKKSSFEYASILMRPEYRSSVDPKYRKPIEAFVRRPLSEEVDEKCSPCPYCSFALPNTALSCANCKNTIPYCCVTGRHMLADDWTQCPHCRFPGLHSAFSERLGTDSTCPMCSKSISPDALQRYETKQIQQRLATYATGVLRDAVETNRSSNQAN